jgi:hypothetical protein
VSRRVTVRGMAPGTAGNTALQPFTTTHASKDSNPRQPSDRHEKACRCQRVAFICWRLGPLFHRQRHSRNTRMGAPVMRCDARDLPPRFVHRLQLHIVYR